MPLEGYFKEQCLDLYNSGTVAFRESGTECIVCQEDYVELPLNLAKSQSLYKIPYSNFFSPILLLGLGLSQI